MSKYGIMFLAWCLTAFACVSDAPSWGCRSDRDCDDGVTTTMDRCVERTCHHTLTRSRPDPASPERQNARVICESDQSCQQQPTTGPYATIYWLDRCDWRDSLSSPLWDERGYHLAVSIRRVGEIRRVHARLELSAGDPMARYRIILRLNTNFTSVRPMIDREVSAEEIERGFDINLGTERVTGEDDGVNLYFIILPIGEPVARTFQWALPVDGVTDMDRETQLVRCLSAGLFRRMPQHGVLHITEGNGSPQCAGPVRQLDVTELPPYYGELVREQSRPDLSYIDGIGRRILTFQGLRGFVDWHYPFTACGEAKVVPDGSLAALRGWERREVGIRPGILVKWTATDGSRHQGVTDRDLVIRDFTPYITEDGLITTGELRGPICTRYNWYRDDTPAGLGNCLLDIQGIFHHYRIVAGTLPYSVDEYPTLSTYFIPRH